MTIEINLEHLAKITEYINLVNHTPLKQIRWVYNGQVQKIDEKTLDDWRYVGLSNYTFAKMYFIEKDVDNG